MAMATAVNGCKFCDIVQHKKELVLKESEKTIAIKDIKPKAPFHFLILSKAHINRPTDLTAADIPLLEEMELTGRTLLRKELKDQGEADTVEDMLRIGFHWPPMITINHLHMHIIYPTSEMGLISRKLIFRPGKVFRKTQDVIDDLRKHAKIPHPLEGNPAKNDNPDALPAHAIVN